MTSLVTIGIPTYKRLSLLKEAVASALDQTYPHTEVLISDDGRSAGIEQWSRETAASHPRLRYERNTGTHGLAGNWNNVARLAKGEFLVIIGDDDRLLPDFTQRMLSAIRPEDALVFSNHYVIDAAGERNSERTEAFTNAFHRDQLTPGPVDAQLCAWRNSIAISSALLGTDDVRRLRFKENLNTPEIEFFVRLANEGRPFRFLKEYLMEYRVHGHSATADGLGSEELVWSLMKVDVDTRVDCEKRKFLEGIVPVAVTRLLARGRTEEARGLWMSEFYPQFLRLTPRGIAAAACFTLPALTPAIVKCANWLKSNRPGAVSRPPML